MAKRFFAHSSALGARICLDEKFKMEESYEVVGVVKDAKYFGVREATESMVYIPVWRDGAGGRTLCVRTTGRPENAIAAARREAAALDPSIPVLQTLTMADQFDNSIAQERMLTTLGGFFGALALLLAAVGLYGVMAHAVTRRVREIGIRMALGARAARGPLADSARDAADGRRSARVIGIPAALALTRLLESFLFGLTPQDPLSIAASTFILLGITGLAGYIPARRATLVDPMIALRYE